MGQTHPRETMTPRERFLAALNRQKVDRVSVGNPTSVATVDSMEACGVYFPDVHLNPEKMARLASTGYELLGFDTISPYFSVLQEAAALGCTVTWGTLDGMPDIRENPYSEPEEIKYDRSYLDQPSTATVLKALRILKKEYGDHVCLMGKVMGPWTLSYHLYGVQKLLMDTILNPDKVRRFLDKLKEASLLFANAQFEAGADVVTWCDHLTGDLAGPDTYRDFLMPVHQEITKKVRGPLILHTCGRTTDRMGHIATAGFAAFHFDSKNVLHEAVNTAERENLLLTGDINNPDVLLGGSPDDVRRDVLEALESGITIISPECAIPLRTPNVNLKAIVKTVREYCFQ